MKGECLYKYKVEPEELMKIRKTNQNRRDFIKGRYRWFEKRANGSLILRRKGSTDDPCKVLGIKIGEEESKFVYAENAHNEDLELSKFPTKKIEKSKVHIEPCIDCEDHQETNFSLGYKNHFGSYSSEIWDID